MVDFMRRRLAKHIDEDVVFRERREEDLKLHREYAMEEYRNAHLYADWEVKTDKVIKDGTILRKVEEMKRQREEMVEVRRSKLAERLLQEDHEVLHELKSMGWGATSEQRLAALAERARELKAKREVEMEEYAEEQLRRRWRDECEEVRLLERECRIIRTLEERAKQLEERQLVRQRECEEKVAMEEIVERERLKQEERHQAEMRRRWELDAEALRILDEQMEAIKALKEEERQKAEKEMEEMKRRWREQDDEAKRKEDAARQRNIEVSRQVKAYNELKKCDRLAALKAEKQMDREMIELSLRIDRESEERERELRAKQRAEAKAYKEHLEEMMKLQKETDAELNAMIKQAMEAQWAKREAVWRREADAKACLMEEVHQYRQRQLQEKEMARRRLQEEKEAERALLEEEMRRIAHEEKCKSEERAKTMAALQSDIVAQINQKRSLKVLQKQAAVEEFERCQMAEKEYLRLAREFTIDCPPEPNYGRKTTQWYT